MPSWPSERTTGMFPIQNQTWILILVTVFLLCASEFLCWLHPNSDRLSSPTEGWICAGDCSPHSCINANSWKRQAELGTALGVVWALEQGRHSRALFPLGNHKAQHKGLTGERLIGEIKARETRWQHDGSTWSCGPRLTFAPCASATHSATTELSELEPCLQYNFNVNGFLFAYLMWYMCLMLFIPCSLTWAEPKLPWHGGYPHGMLQPRLSSRRVLPAFEWEPLIQHLTYFTIPPLLEQQALKIIPWYVGKIYVLEFLERAW